MSVPLTIQLFDAFLGTQEGVHSVILPDVFSSGGSKNVFIDKFGRVVKIGGYSKQNASAYTTDTGADAALVRALIPYRGVVGGTTSRKLVFVLDDGTDEWEIWVSTDEGVTGSLLLDAGAGSVGSIPDSAQFGDNLYITNGVIQPRVYDGSSIATTGLTQSPTITAADAAVSGNLTGNFLYKLVSTIAGVRQAGSAVSTSLLVVDSQGALSWTADANTSVDGYEIYRTTGTGSTFYYLTTISGRLTVAYTDNTSDLTLLENRVLEEHGDAPPVAYYCEPHKQRMWWLRTDDAPTRGYWSDPGEPQSVYGDNYLDFSDSETVGDVITGAIGNYEGLLVVFSEKAVWTVSGTGAIIGDITDWSKIRTNATTGAVSGRAVARVPAGSKFTDQHGRLQTTTVSSLAYFTPQGDIRLFDGDNDLIISHPVRDTARAFNYAVRQKVFVLNDEHSSHVVWFFPTDSATEPDTAVCWNYQYGVWYKWTPMPFGHAVSLDTASDAHTNLVGEVDSSKGAFIYHFFDAAAGVDELSFDGDDIEAIWMTKTLYGLNDQGQPAISHLKRWRWLDVLFRIDQAVNVTVEWLQGDATDNASGVSSITIIPSASELVSSDGSTILTADGSSILVALASAQEKALLQTGTGDYLHDEGLRLRFKSNDALGSWALEAMQLAYQLIPGHKRRVQ